jgi:hypothetical protein
LVKYEAKPVGRFTVILNYKLKELKVGLRFSREEGISFFGLDEVNAALNRGAKVIVIKKGDAIMHKIKENNEGIRLSLSGFSVIVVIDE